MSLANDGSPSSSTAAAGVRNCSPIGADLQGTQGIEHGQGWLRRDDLSGRPLPSHPCATVNSTPRRARRLLGGVQDNILNLTPLPQPRLRLKVARLSKLKNGRMVRAIFHPGTIHNELRTGTGKPFLQICHCASQLMAVENVGSTDHIKASKELRRIGREHIVFCPFNRITPQRSRAQ